MYPGKNWDISEYVSQWAAWTTDIVASLGLGNNTNIWQAAATSAQTVNPLLPKYIANNPWKIPSIFKTGGLYKESHRIKSTSVHYYQTKVDNSTTLQKDIMNHGAIAAGSEHLKVAADYLHNNLTTRVPLVLGEIGSSLGNGSSNANLQAVLGSALWQADFVLHSMALGVDRVNTQLGIVFDFSLWSVDFTDGKIKRNNSVLAPFYGQIFAADFIGLHQGDVQVTELKLPKGTNTDLLSAYAAYESGRLARIAMLNMNFWSGKPDCSPSASSRPIQNVEVAVPENAKAGHVKKLTSPRGADAHASDGITWGGTSWNTEENDGIGRQVLGENESVSTLPISNGTVTVSVAASEAIMLYLVY